MSKVFMSCVPMSVASEAGAILMVQEGGSSGSPKELGNIKPSREDACKAPLRYSPL